MTNASPIIAITRTVPGTIDVPAATIRPGQDDKMTRDRLLAHVAGASIIVSMFHDTIDTEVLDAAGPSLKGVCNFAVGYNNIDVAACAERNIKVTNTPDAVTEGTANMALGLLLAVARRIAEGDRFVRSGTFATWHENNNGGGGGGGGGGGVGMAEFLGQHLTGQTLLIVGAGRIGKATALRAHAFGMRILYVARSTHMDFELAPLAARRVNLEEGLAQADVVSLHTPLTPETKHLIGADQLERMKPSSILINTARGPVVDEDALVAALQSNQIWGAGLDVYEHEPRVHPGLLTLDNVVLTPHIGSAETKYRQLMAAMVSDNARAILQGDTPPNLVQS